MCLHCSGDINTALLFRLQILLINLLTYLLESVMLVAVKMRDLFGYALLTTLTAIAWPAGEYF